MARLAPAAIEVRATHEIMAGRAAQLALFVVQFVAAVWAPAPIFANGLDHERIGLRHDRFS